MSRTIHGLSHKAIAAFRPNPASLAVYWIYVSRMNNEGVAWPSGASLAKTTKWNKEACLNGRTFLVGREALERVEGYIRPEWRKLDEKTLKRKLALDRSEYYRPTGYVMVQEGEISVKYWMLYNGGDEVSDIDEKWHDGKPRRPSSPPTDGGNDSRPNQPELDSSLQLVSTSQLDSKKDSAPSAESQPKPHERNLIFDAVAAGHGITDVGAEGGRIAMIANWLAGTYEGKGARKVGKISAPASTEHIQQFFKDWSIDCPNVNPPMDFVKFVEHWRIWASRRKQVAAPSSSRPSMSATPYSDEWNGKVT